MDNTNYSEDLPVQEEVEEEFIRGRPVAECNWWGRVAPCSQRPGSTPILTKHCSSLTCCPHSLLLGLLGYTRRITR